MSDSAANARSAPAASSVAAPAAAEPRPAPPGIWELAWPSITTNLLFSVIGVVSIKVVAELGPAAAAAVTVGNQIFFTLQAVMMAVSVGTTALVARAWGAGDYDEAIRTTLTSLVVGVLVGIVLTVPVVIWAETIADLFGLGPEATRLAGDFIRWLSVFNVAFAVNFIMSAALRAAGDARTPMWIGVATNVISLFGLYVLVFGHFGFPALGVKGAAIANGTAFGVAGATFLALWFSGTLRLGFRRHELAGALDLPRMRRLVHIGYPAALEQGVFRIGFFVFLGIIGHYYGTAAFAAYGIGVNILSLCFVVGFGFSIAGSTLVGQHLGGGDHDGATASGWRSLRYAMVSMVALGIAIIAGAEPLAGFMIDDPEVIAYTVAFIYILGAVQPLMAVEFALGGALRGAGDTRYPLKATMAGLLGMRCVLAVAFALAGLSVEWVYAALVGDYALKAVMLTRRFRSGRWRTVVPADPLPVP
ncbi:MAG: MATE family efflux transporter [Pseudomonadales bacterium]|jgi:putative MATE family efflux protein|nr:MATE family efflux transporter [Pseudomonadales bacterium]